MSFLKKMGIAVLLAILVNLAALKAHKSFQFSSTDNFALDPSTMKVLNSLSGPVQVYLFFPPTHELRDRLQTLLKQYKEFDAPFSIESVDVVRDVARAQFLAEKYHVNSVDTVLIVYKGRYKQLNTMDVADYDLSRLAQGRPPILLNFKAEQAITSALFELDQNKHTHVYWLMGHGEKSIEDTQPLGVSELVKEIGKGQVDVHELSLADKEHCPLDMDLLIVAGPRQNLLEREVNMIQDYVHKGGRLLYLSDPVTHVGLEPLLQSYGVNLGDDVVIDPARRIPKVSPTNLLVLEFSSHPITAGWLNASVVLPAARSITLEDKGPYISSEPLLFTSPQSWRELDYQEDQYAFNPDKEKRESICVGAAVQGPKEKIVVFGDSDFIVNAQVYSMANGLLITNAIHWLLDQDSELNIPSRKAHRIALHLTLSQLKVIFVEFVLVIPFLWLLAGVLMWRYRRKGR